MRQTQPFGKYLLLERISVGGMAEVFKAKQFGAEGFDKLLAIKRILPSMAQDSDFISMFIDEAKICGQLHHPNICEIYELGRVEESHFIAMEFVWGKDVLQIQNRFRKLRQTMRPDMAAFIALKMCEGLDHAHKKKDAAGKSLNIIHRDISPQNVLVSYEGEVKVIDFGIAKAASRSSKTQAGVLKGKFGYMSPEQVRGLPLDRRSDVFAIGTILYELLVADRLFIGDSDFETLEKVRNVDVPPPSKMNPNCPPALEQIILKALKRDVEDRYQWAADMAADLTTFLMRYEPPFTAAPLAQWMRQQFSTELKREGDVLEQQKKITKDAMKATPPAPAQVHARMGADLPSGGTQALSDGDLELVEEPNGKASSPEPEELKGEATMIVGENGVVGAPGDMPALSTEILQAPVPGIHSPDFAPLKSESTMILGGDQVPVIVPPAGSGAAVRVSPQASTIIEGMSAPVLPQRQTASAPAPTMMPVQPSGPSVVVAPSALPAPHPATGARVSPHRQSTLWKDIVIGIGVALALVGVVLIVRMVVKGGGGKTTLVVTANPARAADVLIDNVKRGHLDEGMPLTLKDITPGSHLVVVRASDGSEFKQQVNLPAGDVAVLPALLKMPVASATPTPAPITPTKPTGGGVGRIQLKITAEGVQVFVDGNELIENSWKDPIPLRAETPHEIKVTKPAREDVVFTVTVKAGEIAQRDIEMLPAYGKIKISSDPSGAEVGVNGKRVGTTPLDVGDLDPGKPARVTIRLKGYAQVVKYVPFDKSTSQVVDVKMTASGDDGFAEGDKGTKVADTSPSKTPDKSGDKKPPKLVAEELKSGGNDPGYLIANTQPWAKVIIDGKDTGKMTPIAPRSKISLKPGKHTITFVADGKKFNFDVMIKAGEDLRLMKQLSDSND